MKKKKQKQSSPSLFSKITKPKKEVLYVRVSGDAIISIDSLRGSNSRSLFVDYIFSKFIPGLVEEANE